MATYNDGEMICKWILTTPKSFNYNKDHVIKQLTDICDELMCVFEESESRDTEFGKETLFWITVPDDTIVNVIGDKLTHALNERISQLK